MLAALTTIAGGWAIQAKPDTPFVVVLGGDTDGYLSPCGCTKPMSGGITRRATAVRSLIGERQGMYLENGAFVHGHSRQDELKAEALAETLKAMNATAIHYSFPESQLGPGMLLAMQQLSDDRLVTSSIATSSTFNVPQTIPKGPFLIGAVDPRADSMASALREKAIGVDTAITNLLNEAERAGLQPILMLQAGRDVAVDIAKRFPKLRLIQYRSGSNPPQALEYVGTTAIASPGEKGKHVIRLLYTGGKWTGYAAVKLEPHYDDDKKVKSIYDDYLTRVADEKLLDKLPRIKTDAFSGNAKCGSCHGEALKVWKSSKHAGALKTLEDENHGRDPDCVSCHVVGLESTLGFRSLKETPQLANVGCESCHGPGDKHSLKPEFFKMGKVGEKSCAKCHVPEHSPNFDFESYWKKIKH
ncbi:MAG: cytochrome c family protein [Fimbriimonadaceae bacterium]|nr:cytochrome c family protein [Fimbriimonadaceae bacterium]